MSEELIACRINGQSVQKTADDLDMPLIWFLREELGLTGAKYSCGIGMCGACNVLVDGRLMRACLVTLRECQGQEIVTIEGVSINSDLHDIQKAWVANDVAQCGYCQPGQIMSVYALLKENAFPSEQELIDSISANYCRCKSYPNMLKAVSELSNNFALKE